MSILNHNLKIGLTPTGTNPLKNQWVEIIIIIIDAGLPHSSICRKFLLDLVHGTSD